LSNDRRRRRRHSTKFKATQQPEKGMKRLHSSSLHKEMLEIEEKEEESLLASVTTLLNFLCAR